MSKNEHHLPVEVSRDRSAAWLTVPPDFPKALVTLDNCRVHLAAQGVQLTSAVEAALRKLVEAVGVSSEPQRFLIARWKSPIHGTPGRVTWHVAKSEGSEQGGLKSHYDRSAFLMVEKDQVIGAITEPTNGEDGIDVMGRSIPAKPGRSVTLNIDDSILLTNKGELIAQQSGVLHRTIDSAKVCQSLEVDEVDFSSGNLRFDGDLVIRGKICDRFLVVCTGNVEVYGLIEAASIDCGRQFVSHRGMTGRGRGLLRVGEDASARFLDDVKGMVQGDLTIRGELMNCNIAVGGDLLMPHGSLIGGRIAVTGSVRVGSIGSQADVLTRIVLGRVPQLEGTLRETKARLKDLMKATEKQMEEMRQLEATGARMSAGQKERITELLFELETPRAEMAKLQAKITAISEAIGTKRRVHVNIAKCLHANVQFNILGTEYRLKENIRGPLEIGIEHGKDPVVRRTGASSMKLTEFARVIMPPRPSTPTQQRVTAA